MRKIILSFVAIAMLFTTSCKKETIQIQEESKPVALTKKSNCPGCEIPVPAPGDGAFGGDCNNGIGNWISEDSYHAVKVYFEYQRNATTGDLEVTGLTGTNNGTQFIVSQLGQHWIINQSTGFIEATMSVRVQTSPSSYYVHTIKINAYACEGTATITWF